MPNIAANRKLVCVVFIVVAIWVAFRVMRENTGIEWESGIAGTSLGRWKNVNNRTCDIATKIVRPEYKERAAVESFRFKNLPNNFKSNVYPRKPAPNCDIEPWNIVSTNKWMIYIIKSAPLNLKNRNAMRQTWLREDYQNKLNYSAIFVIGETDDKVTMGKIAVESKKYGDILQCAFVDKYEALPLKILTAFRWIIHREYKARFVSVTDDDVLVIVPRVANYFMSEQHNKRSSTTFYCGYVYDINAVPFRNTANKWYISEEIYSEKVYPTFCHGALWTVSLQLLQAIYCVSETTNYKEFILEDVLITGILREKLGLGENYIMETIDKRKYKLEKLFIVHLSSKNLPAFMPKNIVKEWKSLEALLGFTT